jgi:hypothetical protein
MKPFLRKEIIAKCVMISKDFKYLKNHVEFAKFKTAYSVIMIYSLVIFVSLVSIYPMVNRNNVYLVLKTVSTVKMAYNAQNAIKRFIYFQLIKRNASINYKFA